MWDSWPRAGEDNGGTTRQEQRTVLVVELQQGLHHQLPQVGLLIDRHFDSSISLLLYQWIDRIKSGMRKEK